MKMIINDLLIEIKPLSADVTNAKNSSYCKIEIFASTTTFLSEYEAEKISDRIKEILKEECL